MEIQKSEVNKEQNFRLTDFERKEKILLDFFYLKNEIETKVEDKKTLRDLKKTINEMESSLMDFFEIDIPKKNITNYINLKNSDFDEEILRLAKYL